MYTATAYIIDEILTIQMNADELHLVILQASLQILYSIPLYIIEH